METNDKTCLALISRKYCSYRCSILSVSYFVWKYLTPLNRHTNHSNLSFLLLWVSIINNYLKNISFGIFCVYALEGMCYYTHCSWVTVYGLFFSPQKTSFLNSPPPAKCFLNNIHDNTSLLEERSSARNSGAWLVLWNWNTVDFNLDFNILFRK